MSFASYLKRRAGEFLLVLISAWAVSAVALNGFYLDNFVATYGYAARLGVALVFDLVLCFVLYAAAFNRSRRAVGIIGYIVLVAVLSLAAMAASSGGSAYADVEGNYLSMVLVFAFSSAAAFVLSRSLAGSMAWFVVAAFVCSLIQAFYQSGEIVMSMVAVISSLSLVVYRNFRTGVEGAQLTKKASSRYALVSAIVPVIVAAAASLAVWFVVIAPLSPGVLDVKLFTDYRQLPVEEYVGTSDQHSQLSYEYTSQNIVDGDAYTTNDLEEDATSDKTVDAASALEQQAMLNQAGSGSGGSSGGGSMQAYSNESDDQQYNPISYMLNFPWVIIGLVILLIIVVALVAFFLVRRKMRMRRLRGYLSLEPREQVIQLYRFILERLRRIGFKQPDGMTMREYAASASHQMDMITEDTGVSFERLTETYIAAVYGDYEPTEDDVVPFAAYYLNFWKAARAHLGNVKYFFKSFRL